MERTVPAEIKKRLDSWNRLATTFRLLHIALGFVGVICPLIVASFADAFSIFQLRFLSFLGAARNLRGVRGRIGGKPLP